MFLVKSIANEGRINISKGIDMGSIPEIIKTFRELQGLNCADVDRACGFSDGSLSRFEKGKPFGLGADRVEQVLKYLQIEVDGIVRFRKGSFIKVLLEDDKLLFIDYSRLHDILDMYRDRHIKVYVHRSTAKDILNKYAKKIYPVPPADALFIRIDDLLFFVKRKKYYLVEVRDLIERLKREYRDIGVQEIESDVDVDFGRITRSGVERIIRDAKPVVSRGLRK